MTERPDITLPEGTQFVSPHLVCAGAMDAMEFYKKAFDAIELVRLPGPDGKLMHGCISVNGSSVMLAEENREQGTASPKTLNGTPVTIHMLVKDADAVFDQAVRAGATGVMPMSDAFWGARYGVVEDPFGHRWAISTPQRPPMSMDELKAAAQNACRNVE